MIYKTNDYVVRVGSKSDATRPDILVDVYQVVNNTTMVVEYEDYVLPRTILTLLELQSKLEEANAAFEAAKSKPKLGLVQTEASRDGSDGLH